MNDQKPGLWDKFNAAILNIMLPTTTEKRLRFMVNIWKYGAIVSGIGTAALFIVIFF